MTRIILAATAAVILAGCTVQQAETTGLKVASRTQAYCKILTAAGPLIVALADAAGAPIAITDAAKTDLRIACAVVNAVPVTAPVGGTVVPVVTLPRPPG